MKLYEYEGKQLFRDVGIPVPRGVVTQGPVQWQGKAVVKSQLLEGARGKRGLVKVTDDVNGAIKELKAQGVETFLVEEFVPHRAEVYISAMLDRRSGEPIIVASPEGGIDVEESKNVKLFSIPLERGVRSFDVLNVEKYLGVKGLEKVVKGLYRLITEYEAELAEINPLAVTESGVVALDSKVILEDNALYRHEELVSKFSRQYVADTYVELEGDVGIIGNGAGLTMATMDMVKLEGGEPADFYDVGGGASRERVKECVVKVGGNQKVKKIVINIFGGITRCDEVAAGIVEAMKIVKKPMFVRLVGTNEEEGHKILRENGIKAYADALSAVRDAIRS
ncbi:succinate--CoA ligase [Sulfodiicoccus acidiphilus]|uniref:Succinate--CoA ligase n=1 Tax=Sulfodiicoccus acidiphilus TaxID=1670455 RepID=A0A348B469_9CREN|nr:succinate--CoA ligase subunit beta [Sulfodiicoccus acidiphilus]BBD72971.1 succinate--CoA ligase [Sulfodiicoccus acidiphilus]GGT87629.1 succinate--CoA ligase [Sulfodiicoccus acidiphilus]